VSDSSNTLPPDLPPLPNGWDWQPLSRLVRSSRGISYGIVQPGSFDPLGVPILRADNVRDGGLQTTDVLRVSPEVERPYARTRLCGGEVLVTLVGAYFGKAAVVPPALQGWNVARAVGVIPIVPDVSPEWVSFCIRSPLLQSYMRNWATTTAQPTLNLRDLARLPIPVPPRDECRAATALLCDLESKLELNRRMSATLEEMARALFKSWFVDFDPVRAKAEGRDTGLPHNIAALFPDSFADSELGEIPSAWSVSTVSVLAEVIDCLHSKKPERQSEGRILLQLTNIKDDATLDLSDKYLISNADYEKWIPDGSCCG